MAALVLALSLSACVSTEQQADGSTRVRISAAQALGIKAATPAAAPAAAPAASAQLSRRSRPRRPSEQGAAAVEHGAG
ncbi:hypothetical protein LP420_24040 [Massilia sp. B-10]|nr:hypothetical protein LP420_24040 [Massilia sp. B-10]